MWETRRHVARPIRTRIIIDTCPACGVETKMLERADWDYAAETWRHRRTCWNVWCGARWSPLSVPPPSV